MKRFLCLLLCAVMLCACAAPATPSTPETPETPHVEETPKHVMPEELQGILRTPERAVEPAPAPNPDAGYDYLVGYGRADISPTVPVGLHGYNNYDLRKSTIILDPLYVTCVAITGQNGESVMLVALDTISSANLPDDAHQVIMEATGNAISSGKIFFNASHSHSTPRPDKTNSPFIYVNAVSEAMAQAAKTAWESREKAVMYTSQAETEKLTFIRHYVCEDGSYHGAAWARQASAPLKDHVIPGDNAVRLIRFDLEKGRDVLLMNFGVHPGLETYGKTTVKCTGVSADVVGGIRMVLEKYTDFDFMFLQAAGGDTLPVDEVHPDNDYDNIFDYGYAMYEFVKQALESETRQPGGTVAVHNYSSVMTVNHSEDHLLDAAKQVQAYRRQNGLTGAQDFAKSVGLRQYQHASGIINRASLGETMNVPSAVFQVGPVGFASTPFETFTETGNIIREGSPYAFNFVLGYTNGGYGYLPVARAMVDYQSYEACSMRFVPGTAEAYGYELAQKLVQLKGE